MGVVEKGGGIRGTVIDRRELSPASYAAANGSHPDTDSAGIQGYDSLAEALPCYSAPV
jgi:hypothetical protein